MKRIILSFIILLAAQIGFAQEEVALEQNINTSINYLNIKAGWDVRLMHRETEGYRIAIVVPKKYEEVAIVDVHVCNIIGDTMTINENTLLPRGTIIELEGNLGFRKINVYDNAIVAADHIMAPEATDDPYVYLGKNADFHINHLQFCDGPMLSVNDESTLRIDTITGQGEPVLELYDGNFEYGQDLLEGKIIVISGNFSISRDDMKALIEAHGGKNSSSVSGKTTYLLAGSKPGPEKVKKAQELGVEIIDEATLRQMTGDSPAGASAQISEDLLEPTLF